MLVRNLFVITAMEFKKAFQTKDTENFIFLRIKLAILNKKSLIKALNFQYGFETDCYPLN